MSEWKRFSDEQPPDESYAMLEVWNEKAHDGEIDERGRICDSLYTHWRRFDPPSLTKPDPCKDAWNEHANKVGERGSARYCFFSGWIAAENHYGIT